MKIFIGIILAIAAVLSQCNGQRHSVSWGTHNPKETLILVQNVEKKFAFLRKVDTDITFPLPGYKNNRPITFINAVDQDQSGNGAFASIKSGGINSTNAIVSFKSTRNHGIDFVLEIYVN